MRSITPVGRVTVVGTPHAGAIGRWWRGRMGRRLVTEFLLLAALFLAYKWVRFLVRDQVGQAFRNATAVIDVEHALNIAGEVGFQKLVLHSTALIQFLNRYYVTAHFLVAVTFLVWMYVRHGDLYPHIRRMVILVTGLSLIGHVVFPLAPPRMLPAWGFVDTMARWGPNAYASTTVASVANQFAAMPSVHFAWALIVAYGVLRASTSRFRHAIILHPTVTLLAIVATANHYWLDAIVAAGLVGVGLAAEAWVPRLVPTERFERSLTTT